MATCSVILFAACGGEISSQYAPTADEAGKAEVISPEAQTCENDAVVQAVAWADKTALEQMGLAADAVASITAVPRGTLANMDALLALPHVDDAAVALLRAHAADYMEAECVFLTKVVFRPLDPATPPHVLRLEVQAHFSEDWLDDDDRQDFVDEGWFDGQELMYHAALAVPSLPYHGGWGPFTFSISQDGVAEISTEAGDAYAYSKQQLPVSAWPAGFRAHLQQSSGDGQNFSHDVEVWLELGTLAFESVAATTAGASGGSSSG